MKIDGLHEPIIDEDTFNLAQDIIMHQKNISVVPEKVLMNPFSGLVICEKCGAAMTRAASNTKINYPVLRCPNRYCNNVSAPIYLIERQLILSLKQWIVDYELPWKDNVEENTVLEATLTSIKKIESKLSILNKQLLSTYDLLEQGIYTVDVFTERNRRIANQIAESKKYLQELQIQYNNHLLQEKARRDFLPSVRHIIDVYDTLEDAEAKNALLNNVIDHMTYLKTERNGKGNLDNINFELTIYPKIPLT